MQVLERKTTNDDGSFCFETAPGTYSVAVVLSPAERSKGLRLKPEELRVKVETEPVLDVEFSQSRVSVSGTVKCLEKKVAR